ncbi:biopolymer transporter ExbD [bacterium]|nr:biopolymer transporter ExbD [bacterium]
MSFGSDKEQKLFTEINITPLTDIFLVLLIIMMVIAPTFQSMGTDINVPEINSGIAVEQKNATVSVTKQGQFYLNGAPITEDKLTLELQKLRPTLEKPEVVVKADVDVKSSEILKIMAAAQVAEYSKLIVAGEPLSKKEQSELAQQDNAPQQTQEQPAKVNVPAEEEWEE